MMASLAGEISAEARHSPNSRKWVHENSRLFPFVRSEKYLMQKFVRFANKRPLATRMYSNAARNASW